VEVSPALAEERGLQSGTWVRLISRYGQVRVRALVTDRVTARALHADEFLGKPVNRLTSSHTDTATNTPAYKETSVHMDVAAGDRREPAATHQLPVRPSTRRTASEVERKWKRPDYRIPGGPFLRMLKG